MNDTVTIYEEVSGNPAFVVMEEAWRACLNWPTPPEFMVIDRRTGEQFRVVSEEARRLREVCSPVGLARLFPALKARTT